MLCGNGEMFGDGTPALKLATNRPLVYVQDALAPHTRDDVWSWIKEAYARWGAVCDWKGERIGDLSDARPEDIVHLITAADLGGGGVLADQMLPYTGGRILRMRINTRIRWRATDGSMGSGTIDPIRTLCHEIGHFQGHSHWPVGAPAELMEPTVSQTIISPQPTEARVSAGWFGQVQTPELPPEITVTPVEVAAGAALEVSWKNIIGPAEEDWLGVYSHGSTDRNAYLDWRYTDGRPFGKVDLPIAANRQAGMYEVRYCRAGSIVPVIISLPFMVKAAGQKRIIVIEVADATGANVVEIR